VRIRIALATAVAVTLIPTLFFTLFSSGPASGRVADGTAAQSAAAGVEIPLRSDVHAEKVARLAAYYAAVTVAQKQQYLAYLAANTMPAAWAATAMCEEGGRNDPRAGYFGILEWHGFGGYPTAGSAPLSVQLAWEAAHGQGPPDAPGRCHAY
jgi:hypothetical protein